MGTANSAWNQELDWPGLDRNTICHFSSTTWEGTFSSHTNDAVKYPKLATILSFNQTDILTERNNTSEKCIYFPLYWKGHQVKS